MKGDSSTIVYIIIIIASILFSLLKKKKEEEPTKKMEKNPNQTASESIISSILGENFNFDETQVGESYPKIEVPEKNINKTIKNTNISHAISKKNIDNRGKTNVEWSFYEKKTEPETEPENYFLDDFDLPQAIVYTEILKRKEF